MTDEMRDSTVIQGSATAGDEMMMSVPASNGKLCDGCKDRMQATPSFCLFRSEKGYFLIDMIQMSY